MGELQATVEISVELHKFFNVDLFQRGLYQVQACLQVSPKLLHQIEVTCEEPSPNAHAHTAVAAARTDQQRAVSQTFQILYRNEEVVLEDVFSFKVHLVIDANKLVESLERAGLQLLVELHFSESSDTSPQTSTTAMQLVSSRTLKLHFSPLRGLHYHLPVLFDYFHLAAVSLTFHAALVAVHQPYIDTPRPKPWYSSPKASGPRGQPAFSTMETVIFGPQAGCSPSSRLSHARSVHRSVCSLLLASYESLQSQLAVVNRLMPAWQRLPTAATDCRHRLDKLSETAKSAGGEEDLMAVANSDIAQLCAELILLWQQFMELACRREQVRRSLARQHHTLRVKRFAEAFFTMDNPRSAATGCFDNAPQRYMAVTEAVRRSPYLQSLPPLPVECAELDGDPASTPVIYEDQYQHVSEFVRRRRQVGRTTQVANDPRAITAALVEELRTASTLPAAEPRSSQRGQSIEVLQRVPPTGAASPAVADAARFVSLNGLTLDEPGTPPPPLPRVDEARKGDRPAGDGRAARRPAAEAATSTSSPPRPPSEPTRRPPAATVGVASPEPKHFLKEKLKNSIRLELRLPVGQRQPRPAGGAVSPESLEVGLFGAAGSALLQVQRGRIVAKRWTPEAGGGPDPAELTEPTDTDAAVSSQLSEPSSSGSSADGDTAPAEESVPRPAADATDTALTLSGSESEATDTLAAPCSESSSRAPPPRPPLTNGAGRPPRGTGLKARLARLGRPPASVLPPRQFRDPPPAGSTGAESLSKSASLQFRPKSNRGGSQSARSSGEFEGDSVYGSLSDIDTASCAGKQKRLSLRMLSGAQSIGSLMARKESRKKRRSVQEAEDRYRVSSEQPPSACTVLEMFSDGFGTRLEDEDEPETTSSVTTSLDLRRGLPPVGAGRSSVAGPARPPPGQPAGRGDPRTSREGRDGREVSCDCYSALDGGDAALRQRLVAAVGERTFHFITAKEQFKDQLKGRFPGVLYSDYMGVVTSLPYFLIPDEYRLFSSSGLHLVVCVHGLDGNAADLRLVRTYLEIGLPGANLEFIMSERNQGDTFSDFDTLTDRLAEEISYHIEAFHLAPQRISFVGHSLGNIIIRNVLTRPQLAPHLDKLHTFLSLSAPHLGTLYNNSGLVNMGMWFMQKLKKSGSLLQLSMKDAVDVRQTFLYRLAMRSQLHRFRHVLLTGSSQDKYVPIHSSRIDLCKAAIRDHTATGAAYREMVTSIIQPIVERPDVSLLRYDVHHALANNANSLIGRAAHIAALDSELFIEKFMVVAGLKYFK
ncbi:protein FAM135A-like [Amphibalanus amphitrite]|uniref:protein FAM135A-like n=1 Tax=Amphibalanus amphitrite TaxID=1232801 RepID=UPI001C91AB48|nr:protein FAM135A-like [Amphibalanus amphitrite]